MIQKNKMYVSAYKCKNLYSEYKYIINGRCDQSVDQEEKDLIRFMIGGIDSK